LLAVATSSGPTTPSGGNTKMRTRRSPTGRLASRSCCRRPRKAPSRCTSWSLEWGRI
jgi:hypothetical protein